MKITIVLGAFFPVPPLMGGAVEKIWYGLADEFAHRGHQVVLISRKIAQLPRHEIRGGVSFIRCSGFDAPGSLLLLKFYDLLYSLRARVLIPRSDIVISNTFWLPLFYSGAYVHVVRYPKGQMRLYRKAVRLQTPSRAMAAAIIKEAPALRDRVQVIPNPAPTPASAKPAPTFAERQDLILYVGRVHPEKGIHLLIQSFAALRTRFAHWRLMIVGSAEEKFGGGGKDYLAMLQHDAPDSVIFTGPVFDAVELEERFRAAKVFVYPSLAERGESFGLAPLEAMTHGCAVLVSGLECFQDFVADNTTGFVFNHRVSDPAETLASRLGQVLGDADILAEVAHAGQLKSAEYTVDRIADRFLQDFQSILNHD